MWIYWRRRHVKVCVVSKFSVAIITKVNHFVLSVVCIMELTYLQVVKGNICSKNVLGEGLKSAEVIICFF